MSTLLHSLHIHPIQAVCVCFLILGATFFDVLKRRIPNWLVAAGLIVSLLVQIWFHSTWAWIEGMLVGFALFLPGYLTRQMGAGDVKLMAAVGAFFSAGGAFKIGLTAYLIGGGYALLWMVWQRDNGAWWQYLKLRLLLLATMSENALSNLSQARPRTVPMPYSVPIAIAVVYALFAGWQ